MQLKFEPGNDVVDNWIRRAAFHLPWIGKRLQAWVAAANQLDRLKPGHFYSPIADDATIDRHARFDIGHDRSKDIDQITLDGMDLRPDAQLEQVRQWDQAGYFDASVFRRYQPDNEYFMMPDAIMASAIVAAYQPRRIIEVGSGHSTLALLDRLEASRLHATQLDLIEPYPERLLACLRDEDSDRVTLHRRSLDESDIGRCRQLTANDVLLIDSSHIYKVGSDVQLLFESILPCLASGVVVHIHDVFFPFDYPASWLRRGHHYNEAYVLRAFLQFNRDFEIVAWNDWLRWQSSPSVPAILRPDASVIASSLWIRRMNE